MITEHDRLLMIDSAETQKAFSGFFVKPTFDLIIKSLSWSMEKTADEIHARIEICNEKADNGPRVLRCNWELIIETLRWVLEETEIDPLESRKQLIPFA